jgi:hypothetical protein
MRFSLAVVFLHVVIMLTPASHGANIKEPHSDWTCVDYIDAAIENNIGASRNQLEAKVRQAREAVSEVRAWERQRQHPGNSPGNAEMPDIDFFTGILDERLADLSEFEENSALPKGLVTCLQEANAQTSIPASLFMVKASAIAVANHTLRSLLSPLAQLQRHWGFAIYMLNKMFAPPHDIPQSLFRVDINNKFLFMIEASAYVVGAAMLSVAVAVVGITFVFPAIMIFTVCYKWAWIVWVRLFLLRGVASGSGSIHAQALAAAQKMLPELAAQPLLGEALCATGAALVIFAAMVVVLLPWISVLRRLATPTRVITSSK